MKKDVFLLNVQKAGNAHREKFIKKVNERSARFEEPTKRNKLNTSQNEGVKPKKTGDNKHSELKMERNLYGRLLCIAIENSIDLSVILSYPITPVPLSMCHIDGSIASTQKSKLMTHLEKRIRSLKPSYVDCHVLDGMFYLRTFTDLPASFGRISEIILRKICNLKSPRIDLLFDSYPCPSSKDVERKQRNADRETTYQILRPRQERPSNMNAALKCISFKKSIVDFLLKDWHNEKYSEIIANKKIFT